jgi:hypothetical protein
LLDAEDATLRNDGCKGIVARRKERDVLLRREELGGVLDLTEQSDERGEVFLAGEDCCEVLCRGEGSSECCQEKIVGTHFSKVGFGGGVSVLFYCLLLLSNDTTPIPSWHLLLLYSGTAHSERILCSCWYVSFNLMYDLSIDCFRTKNVSQPP